MSYPKFATYNVLGGVIWVGSLTTLGYLLGEHPWVKQNFSIVALAMIIIPGLPAVWVFIKTILEKRQAK
jgi:membrane-associated protein